MTISAIAVPIAGTPAAALAAATEGAVLTANGGIPETGDSGFAQLLGRVTVQPDERGTIDVPVTAVDAAEFAAMHLTVGMRLTTVGEASVASADKDAGEQTAAAGEMPVEQDLAGLFTLLPLPAAPAAGLKNETGEQTATSEDASTQQSLVRLIAPPAMTVPQPASAKANLAPAPAMLLADEAVAAKDAEIATVGLTFAPADKTMSSLPRGHAVLAGDVEIPAQVQLSPPIAQPRAVKSAYTSDGTAAATLAQLESAGGDGLLQIRPADAGHQIASFFDAALQQRSGAASNGSLATFDLSGTQMLDQTITHQLDLAHESEWLDQLATDIARTGGKEGMLRFRLHPESLGSLQVEVSQGAAGTSIRLSAETEAARAILVDAQPRLLAEARAQGVRIAESHVDVGSGGHPGAGDHRNQQQIDERPFVRTAGSTHQDKSADASPSGRNEAERYA